MALIINLKPKYTRYIMDACCIGSIVIQRDLHYCLVATDHLTSSLFQLRYNQVSCNQIQMYIQSGAIWDTPHTTSLKSPFPNMGAEQCRCNLHFISHCRLSCSPHRPRLHWHRPNLTPQLGTSTETVHRYGLSATVHAPSTTAMLSLANCQTTIKRSCGRQAGPNVYSSMRLYSWHLLSLHKCLIQTQYECLSHSY